MASKLWQSTATGSLHPLVESYTVGDDQVLDQYLLGHDITATKAHAHMLEKIGVLTSDEYQQLAAALDELLDEWKTGAFTLTSEHEDGHTAIELYLTEKLGPIGKKVHTGRSRNDQALVMMRLFIKTELEAVAEKLEAVAQAYAGKITAIKKLCLLPSVCGLVPITMRSMTSGNWWRTASPPLTKTRWVALLVLVSPCRLTAK